MSQIRNTTQAMQDDPAEAMLLLAESMGPGGSNAAIGRQERDGQQQLVNSDRLPTDCRDRDEMETLGFTFGEPDADDPLFMSATLPAGWSREAGDHDMWSYVLDEHGHKRVAVFYKAAFYDRKAFMRLETLDWYVTQFVEYDGASLIFDDKWATREAVLAAMARGRDEALAEACKYRGYADEDSRTEENQGHLLGIAVEKDERAARYEAAIAAL